VSEIERRGPRQGAAYEKKQKKQKQTQRERKLGSRREAVQRYILSRNDTPVPAMLVLLKSRKVRCVKAVLCVRE
jgi:hypothetical protein